MVWRFSTSAFGTVVARDERRPDKEHIVSTNERRTGRARIRFLTTGLAVAGTLGVVGVGGGLALHDQLATSTGSSQSTTQSGSRTSPTSGQASQTSTSQQSSTTSGVSTSNGSAHAQSSGS